MNKRMDDKPDSEELMEEWTFPDVHDETDSQEEDFIDEIHATQDEDHSHDMKNEMIPEVPIVSTEEAEAIALKDEAIKLKFEYERKLETVNAILSKLQSPMANIDDDIVTLMQDIIKKVTARIIRREISLDTQVLRTMIDDLNGMVQSKNGLTNIYLSPVDYERLDAEGPHPTLMVQVDSSLNEGDVIVKSNTSEVRGILDERIELLTKVENE